MRDGTLWDLDQHRLEIQGLEKHLGADFYKVPRATAVRILSAVRESILWILKLFSERQH